MRSPYRIERERGTKEACQQLAVLREKWPLAFRVDVRPLAMAVARRIAAVVGWSLPYTRRGRPLENGSGLLPRRALP
jgi:hypothetical protein